MICSKRTAQQDLAKVATPTKRGARFGAEALSFNVPRWVAPSSMSLMTSKSPCCYRRACAEA
jgi:hypothetical protein